MILEGNLIIHACIPFKAGASLQAQKGRVVLSIVHDVRPGIMTQVNPAGQGPMACFDRQQLPTALDHAH